MARFTLLITSSPFDYQSTALQFAHAVLSAGHSIEGVFFYQGGVAHANTYQNSPSDEQQNYRDWLELAKQGVSLHVCVTAAARRGLANREDAEDRQLSGHNIDFPFIASGLGQFVELTSQCDRLVQF